MSDQAIRFDDPTLTEEEKIQRQIERNRPLVALLDSWLAEEVEDEEEECRIALEFMRGIDEHRSERKLYAEILAKWPES